MRRLLLITDSFPPAFAPRMGYLCKYLKGIGGWQVTVLHMPPSDNSHSQSFGYLSGFADKVYEYDGTDGARKLFRGQVADMLHGRNSIWGFIMMVWSKLVMRILGEPTNFTGRRFVRELLSQDEYDVILASTGGHCNTVNKLAYYASRRANIPVVLDFRDMFEQYAHGRKTVSLRSRISLWTRNRLIRHANNVIGVCAEETEILKKFNDRVHNIMNGYDPDVFSPLFPVKSDVFKIVYVGSTNTTTYPVELFVKGFTRFINGRFKPSVHVEFYSTKETYESGVAQYLSGDVQSFFERRDCVAQTKLPSVLAQASVLIVFGHKTTGVPVGVSTKVYEYLAVNRPILEINLGDLRKCEDIIRGGGGHCLDVRRGLRFPCRSLLRVGGERICVRENRHGICQAILAQDSGRAI